MALGELASISTEEVVADIASNKISIPEGMDTLTAVKALCLSRSEFTQDSESIKVIDNILDRLGNSPQGRGWIDS